jgi:hypothetical protein
MNDNLSDRHRVIVMRLRLNDAESKALAQLTAASGINASELLRSFIYAAANALPAPR